MSVVSLSPRLSLSFHKFRKDSILRNQFLIGAVLLNPALVKYQNPVAVANGRQSMGNDDAGTFHGVQGIRDLLLGNIIQGRCGLVENQDPGLGGNGAGNHEALALAAGDASAAFLEDKD